MKRIEGSKRKNKPSSQNENRGLEDENFFYLMMFIESSKRDNNINPFIRVVRHIINLHHLMRIEVGTRDNKSS